MLPVWLTDTVTTDLREATRYTLLWGLEGMVLRTVGDVPQHVPHVNEAQIRHHLDANDLLLPAVEPGLLECGHSETALWRNQLATFNETTGFCQRVGVPRIVTSAFVGEPSEKARVDATQALHKAASKAGSQGLQLLVRNHSEHVHRSIEDLMVLVQEVDHPALKIAWDLVEDRSGDGVNDIAMADIAPRLGMIYVGSMSQDGDLDWMINRLEALLATGYSGPVCLVFREEEGPTGALRGSTNLLRALRQLRKTGTAGSAGR